jgi:bacillithiol biosynthesis cysteine-adding enzyme BshC
VSSIKVIDTPLALGALARGGMSGSTPDGWYPAVPRSADEWRTRVGTTAQRGAAWLDRLRPALGDGARLLDRVAARNGVVVTTGQQPGLFGGPLYTWHKAISALEFASALEDELGVPVAPVFWAATDDADFTECSNTVIATDSGAELVSLTSRPEDGVPMSYARIGDEVIAARRSLEAAAGSLADPRAMHAVSDFRPGATVGDAYVSMLRSLLEPLGIAVLDASHECVGMASRPLLEAALGRARNVHDALTARRDAMVQAGFEPTVDVGRDLALVFAWEGDGRGAPVKRRLTLAECDDAQGGSSRLSPNVLLRPVVERAILPTVAYLAGPGELAYFAQVSAVADAVGAAQPLAVPRWSGMVLPADVSDGLARLGLDVEDLRDPHAAEGRLALAALSPEATTALAELRETVARSIARLDGALTPEARDGARNQLTLRVDRLERRLVAAAKHREAATMRRIAMLRGVLFPFGKPQERALNVVPVWSKYGDEYLGEVRRACAAHAERMIGRAAVHA